MKKILAVLALLTALPASLCAFTTGSVPTDGVYKFTFGVSEAEGFAVPATAVYDVRGTSYYDGTENATFSYGFLGTTADSYKDDVPNRSKVVDPRQIDGFSVVEGQYIVLSNATDLASRPCVAGPAAADYIPATASSYEGRYPVRFAMRGEERAYYIVTATVANASSTANADVTLYSERSHLIAHHMALAPGQTRTFSWSVELAPNLSKSVSDYYYDDTINVIVVGENAALASVTVVKQGQAAGTIRGTYHESGVNTNKTLWICTDSTGCDYPIAVPFCSLQNYGGVGAGLSRWAPSDLSIRNQGEGGLGMGSHSHRTTCQLKAGDYLYVEYGHNDNESTFLNNIGAYLADAKAAGAYLIIVSPVERHTSWDSTTGYWKASLGWARDLGRNWVEDQIVNSNETCVAFVDLNTHYLNWMNSEVDRICARFPDMNRSAAINYYYQSAKGKNVDGTHLNTAGEDQGAYAFWQAALAVVAAGDEADATDSEKAQANVIRGITTGYKSKLGDSDLDNVPWVVTDDIIELGVAPNSYWDTPVTTSLKYKNEAVVSSVAATTNADGTVSISGATMRILNPGNYYKAVYDIVSADGATTNRYWSYYNYDVGGINAASGTLINPEYPGFITEDRASGGSKDLDTLTIPAGGKAYVWIAKADDATWQVTTNAPCSAKYPVEAWSRVLVDEDCTSATVPSDEWHVSTQAEWTLTPNVGGWLDFTGTGYATDGKTKKNFGLFRTFDETGAISGGRYRVSFKMLYTAGNIAFYVIKNIGETSNPTGGGVPLVQFTGKAATVFGSTDAEITIEEDNEGNEVASNRINVDAWTDVDMIVDMDLGTALVSVGGSDYQTFTVPAYSTNEAIANTPYKYFAMSLAAQMSHFGSFDDIKIVQLAATSELPEVTVSVAANDDDLGTVATTATELTQNGSVTLTATPNEGCVFLGWIDNESGETLSTDTTWNIARVHNNVAVTADFRVVWTAIASSADEAIGSVSVGGSSLTLPQYIAGDDIAFRAIPSDEDVYAFVNWADANDNVVTNAPFFKVQDANENLAYTANFREYGREENRTKLWDFAGYYGANVTHTEKTGSAYEYDGLTIYLSQNDTLTENGLYWGNVGSNKSGTNVGATGRHIEWTPSVSGTASVTFSVGSIDTGKNQYPEMFVVAGDADMATSGGYAHLKTAAKDTDYTLSFEVTAGTLYKIYTYYYNRSSTVTVKKMGLTYAPTYYTVEASVNNASLGTAAVSADEVLSGKAVTFTAKPVSDAYKFVNWTDGEDNEVSTDAVYTTAVTANLALTANFALDESENYVAAMNFERFAGDGAVTTSGSSLVTQYGDFEIYTSDSSYGNDSITENGIYWHVPANDIYAKKYNADQPCDYVHYIKLTAQYSGTVTIVFQVDKMVSSRTLSMNVTSGELSSATKNNTLHSVDATAANIDQTFTYAVTAGTTYWFWCASQNWSGAGAPTACTISSLTYTHASDPVTLTLAAESGTVAINGVVGAGEYTVQKGEYVKLSVTPAAGSAFDKWVDANEETISTEATFWYEVAEAATLTAKFRTADAHNFVWNPAVAEGAWNDPVNWLYEGIVAATTYPSDASQDVVTFNSVATVNLTATANASNVVINANATFNGNIVSAYYVTGEGTLTLSNAGFANHNNQILTNLIDIVMAEGTTNTFKTISNSDTVNCYTYIGGDISGSGCFKVELSSKKLTHAYFAGNNNEFYGDVYTSGGTGNRNVVRWMNGNAAGTNSYWHIGHSYHNANGGDVVNSNGTYYYGGYDGAWYKYNYANNFTLEIGHLNRDSSITVGTYSKVPNITKVGTANLTLGSAKVGNLTINGGTVTMPIGTKPETLAMAEGTKIILVGDAEWTTETTTNLFSYTTLSGVTADALTNMVEVTGLASTLMANISVADGTVTATFVEKPPEPTTVPVFLTGGQSNTEGRIPNSDLPPYLASNSRALVSNHSTVSDSTELGTFSAWAPTDKWAFDTEVYYQLAQGLGTEFYVVKTSYGGTSVSWKTSNSPSSHPNQWYFKDSKGNDYAGYHWSADPEFYTNTVSAGRTFVKNDVTYDGQSMLKVWIENIDAALDALIADGKTPDVKAIIWHQGESDKNNGSYASDLTAVVTYIRQHLATKLGDEKYLSLPFFCGNIPRKSSLFKVNLDNQFKTIEETENNNMHVVDIYDLTMLSDNKHFDATSAITFGQRLFNRMIDEGVIEAEKVEVAECVRSPDFGVEQVINNTTTWTWDNMSGDIATALTNIDGIYFHAASGNSRKVQIYNHSETLNWTIGDTTSTVVSKGAYCTAYANSSSSISQTSTAGDSNAGSYMVAMNAGRAGKFEVFYWAREGCTVRMYLNGQVVDSHEASDGELVRLYGENTAKSVYYIGFGKGAIMGARFVPTEEMPAVTLTIGTDGYGTFGNLYESNFVLPEGVKAYAINAVDGQPTLLSMTEVGALNLGDAVVVSGEQGTYTLTSAEGAAYDSENLMVVQKETGILPATSGSDFINFMQSVDANGALVFTKSDGTQELAAGKAFFSITEGDDHSQQETLITRATGDTSVFYWTGKGTDTLFTTTNNWAWADGEAPLELPGAGDTVIFNDEAKVTFSGDTTSSGMSFEINANVTFKSDNDSKQRVVYPTAITGEGTLTLDNIKLQTITYGTVTIVCGINVAAGNTLTLYARGKYSGFVLEGAFTGSGTITLDNSGNAGCYYAIYGDMSSFQGILGIKTATSVYTTVLQASSVTGSATLTNATADTAKLVLLNGGTKADTVTLDGEWETVAKSEPTVDDAAAEVTEIGDGSYTVEIAAQTATITIPENVTVSEVVVSTNTTTVTGVPDGAAVKVAVSWEGGSAQYAIVSVAANGAVTLNEDAVVTVGSEEIPLKPVLSDATDDEKPLEVSSDSVSVGVKTIPGLVYRLNRATTPNGETSPVATEKATSSRVSLTDTTKLPAAFYRISADLK